MYHGTSAQAAALIRKHGFKISTGPGQMLGDGVYASRDKRKAQHYADKHRGSGGVVLVLRVRVGRVKRIDRQGHPLQKTWQQNGYDTAWVPPSCNMVPSGLTENCIKDPRRIRIVG